MTLPPDIARGPYSKAELQSIRESFNMRLDLAPADFEARLQWRAFLSLGLVVPGGKKEQYRLRPSTRERNWRSLESKAQALHKHLGSLPREMKFELAWAHVLLRAPPNSKPSALHAIYAGHPPVVAAVVNSLERLAPVLSRAVQLASNSKRMQREPDEDIRRFVRELRHLYAWAAAKPQRFGRRGEFARFVGACLAPYGRQHGQRHYGQLTDDKLYDLIRRALGRRH